MEKEAHVESKGESITVGEKIIKGKAARTAMMDKPGLADANICVASDG